MKKKMTAQMVSRVYKDQTLIYRTSKLFANFVAVCPDLEGIKGQ